MVAILELRSVTRIHRSGELSVSALGGVSLTVHPGELVVVMGPSGSGKSTLLSIAGGMDKPTSGTVHVEGRDLFSLSRDGLSQLRRRSVGYVFQSLNLIPSLTAVENVALPLELDGTRARRARAAALSRLADVGMEAMATRFPHELSGGQQQRVAIARALVGRRRLVLADEPTGALDSQTGQEVLRLLRDRANGGAAVVLVTHDGRHSAWADRTITLRDGLVDDPGPNAEPVDRHTGCQSASVWRSQ